MTITTEQLEERAKFWREKAAAANTSSRQSVAMLYAEVFEELLHYRDAAREAVPVYQMRILDGSQEQYTWAEVTHEEFNTPLKNPDEWEKRVLHTAPPAPAVPPGYKLAPNEPTESMVIDGFESDAFLSLVGAVIEKKGWPYGCEEAAECVTGIFKAMIARIPAAPEVSQ